MYTDFWLNQNLKNQCFSLECYRIVSIINAHKEDNFLGFWFSSTFSFQYIVQTFFLLTHVVSDFNVM